MGRRAARGSGTHTRRQGPRAARRTLRRFADRHRARRAAGTPASRASQLRRRGKGNFRRADHRSAARPGEAAEEWDLAGGGRREAGGGWWEAGGTGGRRKAMSGEDESYGEYAALLDAVRGIRWPARAVVRGGIPGVHASRLRGISAEFTEYRPYRQGDETRRVDWKLFARSDRAYIRLSNDRAILPTMIVLDASASMGFPVATQGKWKLAAQIGVALGAVARNGGDPVGLVVARSDDSLMLRPRMRRTVTHEIVRAVSAVRPGGDEPLAPSVSIASRGGGRVVVVSDL